MATRLQRTKSILDALLDGDASNPVIGKVLDAYGYTYDRNPPVPLTNDQKAGIFLREIRNGIKNIVRDSVRSQAAAAAADAADSNVDLGSDA